MRAEKGEKGGSLLPAEAAWLFSKECKIYRLRKKENWKKRSLTLD